MESKKGTPQDLPAKKQQGRKIARIKRWLQPGNLLKLEIEGIATLRNQVMRKAG